MKLLLNLVCRDFKKNRVITTALAVFLILSAVMMAGGLRVAGTMVSSLKALNEVAVPPEYLQMHKGTYDENAFDEFVKSHDYITKSLVVKMLDIANANILYNGETFEKCLMDNGLVVQNQGFDHLLDMDNKIAVVNDGEIGVPVYYAQELGVRTGDTITLRGDGYSKTFTVSVIIRDSTMNAALTSSKRFLISQADIDTISAHMGQWEECFEFLLKDGTSTSVLQKDYMDAKMPSNGVGVTGSLLNMMNVLSYGIVAFIIIAISILLIMMSLLCLTYIIRATMSDEDHTIGEMKAIGFSPKSIEELYQTKYVIIAILAAVVGYLAAIPFGNFFSAPVIAYCGNGTGEWMKWMLPLLGVIFLGMIVSAGCHRILRKNLNNTVVSLMKGDERTKREGHYALPSKGMGHPNITMAFGGLKCKWKEYLVIFFVFVFSSFLIMLPMNMKNTIENPSFITYMGVGECDIRIDMQYSEKMAQQKESVMDFLKNDPEIEKYEIYENGYVQFRNTEGEWKYLRVENGNESTFPLEYSEGAAPNGEHEMALSSLQAAEAGKKVGDTMTVTYRGSNPEYRISGIYQDITYGGKTAKASLDFNEDDVEVNIIYLNVKEGVDIQKKTIELRKILAESKITPISEFISQTLGGISKNMSMIEGASVFIAMMLVILITVMFLQLVIAREQSEIAVRKAIGLSNFDIRLQIGIRIFVVQFVAIILGTFLANSLGEMIFGLMLSSMGVSKITMLTDPAAAFLLWPLIQLMTVVLTVFAGTGTVRKIHIRNQIME